MGAPRRDYERVAPPNSFIHVDDFASPRHLALYLHHLDHNDRLYNDYFRWKGTGSFIDTRFFCRVCALLHEAADRGHVTIVEDVVDWWQSGQCLESRPWVSWNGG